MNYRREWVYPMTKEAKEHMNKVDGVEERQNFTKEDILLIILFIVILIIMSFVFSLGGVSHI